MSNFLIDYEAIEQYVKNLVVKNNMNEWFNKLSITQKLFIYVYFYNTTEFKQYLAVYKIKKFILNFAKMFK
jgi:hypothetical protein